MSEDNSRESTVFVGKKNTKAYVFAVITQINQGAEKITIKARGKVISKAVDVAEMSKNRFAKELSVKEVKISTEELTNEDGSKTRVSAIEICLEK